ncbi:2-amino-4-hydroxy-6-hydroxymethyldihydropteridine diphosphokinase [Candidatus Aerophobetes bacterium]|uniref:2-amino-4-hydroxy-6-hydroxymethyldihydropteridine diphosphokinase n=1 Tax=Aerophobetes bacterium TaxID=2030807 RepID=A0A662DJD8_UNCAE|nr:MAG: 2-amino-4-hydroxy-6-hydroxymethyldihydropteridine diphosphokinase [Candidatus Aerophobetes bacterium]
MTEIYIGLGTNTGKRLANIQTALKKLKDVISVEKVSSLYLTEPVGVKGGWFVNCVVKGHTEKEPLELLQQLLKIEDEMGRVRGKREKRTIDLDLLFYGEKIIEQKNLTVPHPRVHRRRFVLLPLAEINPELKHPLLKKSIQTLLDQLDDASRVEKIEKAAAG